MSFRLKEQAAWRRGANCVKLRSWLRGAEELTVYPYEVYVLRKRVNLSSESSQLYSDGTVNQIRTGRQMLMNKA